jgi:hypothetical protein
MKHLLIILISIISFSSCTQSKYTGYNHKLHKKSKHPAVWSLNKHEFLYFRDKNKLNNRIFSGVSAYNNPLFYNSRSSNTCSANW